MVEIAARQRQCAPRIGVEVDLKRARIDRAVAQGNGLPGGVDAPCLGSWDSVGDEGSRSRPCPYNSLGAEYRQRPRHRNRADVVVGRDLAGGREACPRGQHLRPRPQGNR